MCCFDHTVISMPKGSLGLVALRAGLSNAVLMRCGVVEGRRRMKRSFPDTTRNDNLLPSLQRQLADYFNGKAVRFRVRLDLSAMTPFQQEVLSACADVGYGETVTYGELARRVRRPKAARAIGGAMARNPVPVVVPCHRVVGGDGKLGGFSAEHGVAIKQWLLEMEQRGKRS